MEGLLKAASDFLAAVLGAIGFVGRARRRDAIRQDLALLAELVKSGKFGPDTAAHLFLVQHITIEVAEYSGVFDKKRKQWSSIVLAVIVGVPLAYWTFRLDMHGFQLLSIIPGLFAFFMLFGGIGLLFESPKVPDESETRIQAGLKQLRAALQTRDAGADESEEEQHQ